MALMRTGSIPDQNDLAWQITLDMLEGSNHLVALDGAFEMTFVDLARHRQSDCSRQDPPITGHPSQDRPFASPGPGGRQRFEEREAKFIKEHGDCADPPTLFLSWANLLPARPLPVPHRARRPVVKASEHYSLTDPAFVAASSGDKGCQIPS